MSSDPSHFGSWIRVEHDDNQPAGTVIEINGGSANVNEGFGGRLIKADKPETMMDNVFIYIGHGDGRRSDDLAKGAGGDYRYLDWTSNMTATKFITEIALWRQSVAQSAAPQGWTQKSDNINEGRAGDYLYLLWNTEEYTGPKPTTS